MTLNEFLNLAAQGIYLLIAILTLVDFVRHPDRPRLDIALIFSSFALNILLQNLAQLTGRLIDWVNLLNALILIAHPYLLLRVVEHFRPVPLLTHRIALGGMVASSMTLLMFSPDLILPSLITLLIVAYFIYVEGYAVIAFGRGALTTAGVTRRRFSLAAGGSGLLAGLILLAGINAIWPMPSDLLNGLSQFIAILSGVCYYLSFAPPGWLRHMWQLSELHRFLAAVGDRPSIEQASNVLNTLCTAATRSVGGTVAGVALWDEGRQQLSLQPLASSAPLNAIADLPITGGILGRAWQAQQPLLAVSPTEVGPEAAQLVEAAAAKMLYVVPIMTAQQCWGLLLVFRQGYSLFAADELKLLALFADQSAILMSYATLLAEQHHLIDELRQRTVQLEVANQDLEAFSYSVSHDLRAPLRAIDGFSQALRLDCGDQLDATGQDYLNRVLNSTQHMAQLIDDLLQIARVTRAELQHEAVNLADLARSIAADLQQTDPERQVKFAIASAPPAQGDARLLRLVLENLLGNAWKFTARQPQPCIEFGAMEQSGEPVYFVRDNGAGFNRDRVHKLFNAFQRLHTTSEFPGTGIGLATVQRIIHRHGGRVWAEGMVDQGATFYFVLP